VPASVSADAVAAARSSRSDGSVIQDENGPGLGGRSKGVMK
jgi:hypothetical protein